MEVPRVGPVGLSPARAAGERLSPSPRPAEAKPSCRRRPREDGSALREAAAQRAVPGRAAVQKVTRVVAPVAQRETYLLRAEGLLFLNDVFVSLQNKVGLPLPTPRA